MERVLAAAQGLARLDDSGDLIVSPLPVEQLSTDAVAPQQAAAARLPPVQLPALLIVVYAWTGSPGNSPTPAAHGAAIRT